MKTIHVVVALGALATLAVVSLRAAPSETSAADREDGLVTMTPPASHAATVIEPRADVLVVPESIGYTTPTKRTSVSAKAVKVAVTSRTPTPTPTKAPTPTPAKSAVVTTPVAATPAPVLSPERPAPARAPAPGRLTLQAGSRLWFDGTSNVKDFTCKASTLEATVITSMPDAAPAIVAAEKSVTSVELRVPVAALDCANGTMNDHLRNALGAKDHPVIAFSLGTYELTKATEGAAVTLTGELTIRGKAQPVTFVAQASTVAGALHLTGFYELNMKDYGVKPPSLMLGTMKVREKVKVRFDLLLKD